MANRHFILAVFPGLIVALVGCGTKPNPYYCEGRNPDNNCTEQVICHDNRPCAPGVCDLPTMTCVECTMNSQCSSNKPICANHSCQLCTAHTDCPPFNACLPDGSCATSDMMIAYVAPGGTDNPDCSLVIPCTVAGALKTGRTYVKFQGVKSVIKEAVTVSSGRSVTFLADPGATLTNTGTGAIVTVTGDQTSLSIYDLSISNAPNNVDGIGVLIPLGQGAPSLSLTRVSITNNPGGGVSISNGTFSIIGSVFFNNGNTSTLIGGVSIGTSENKANKLEFNSFALNRSQGGVGPAIQCVAGNFTAKNNIMSGNGTSPSSQVGGPCAHAYSMALPGTVPPGMGNSDADPLFVDQTRGDLHLQSKSPARGHADPSSDLNGDASRDIDGNKRVPPVDIGAYQSQ